MAQETGENETCSAQFLRPSHSWRTTISPWHLGDRHRFFGRWPVAWAVCHFHSDHSFADAFTGTAGLGLIVFAIGALLLRVNLLIALAASVIMNPLTAFPIYLSAHRTGQYCLEHYAIGEFTLGLFSSESRTGRFMEASLYLWTGFLIFSTVSAFVGNAGARLAWRLGRWYKSKRKK